MTPCLLQHQRCYVSIKFQNSKILLQMLLQFTYSKTSGLPSDMCATVAATHSSSADPSAVDLNIGPTSASLLIKILVTGSSSSCKVFCSSIADRRVFLESLVLWFPSFKICHILLSANPPTSSPLTLAYSCPSRLFPLPFRCNPSLAKSPSSIQLF